MLKELAHSTQKRVPYSQIIRAENLKLSHGGYSQKNIRHQPMKVFGQDGHRV